MAAVGPGCDFKNALRVSISGIAGAQPGLDTTIDAQAEPRRIACFRSDPWAIAASIPAKKLSPAPLGLIAVTG